jgi:hypothetical protein
VAPSFNLTMKKACHEMQMLAIWSQRQRDPRNPPNSS